MIYCLFKARLLTDIFSNKKDKGKNKIYGKKNDIVEVISIRGDVLLVRGKENFAVHKNEVNEIND